MTRLITARRALAAAPGRRCGSDLPGAQLQNTPRDRRPPDLLRTREDVTRYLERRRTSRNHRRFLGLEGARSGGDSGAWTRCRRGLRMIAPTISSTPSGRITHGLKGGLTTGRELVRRLGSGGSAPTSPTPLRAHRGRGSMAQRPVVVPTRGERDLRQLHLPTTSARGRTGGHRHRFLGPRRGRRGVRRHAADVARHPLRGRSPRRPSLGSTGTARPAPRRRGPRELTDAPSRPVLRQTWPVMGATPCVCSPPSCPDRQSHAIAESLRVARTV